MEDACLYTDDHWRQNEGSGDCAGHGHHFPCDPLSVWERGIIPTGARWYTALYTAGTPVIMLRVLLRGAGADGKTLVKFACVPAPCLASMDTSGDPNAPMYPMETCVFSGSASVCLTEMLRGIHFPESGMSLTIPLDECPYFVRHHPIQSIHATQIGHEVSNMVYPPSEPMFENLCGSVKFMRSLDLVSIVDGIPYIGFQRHTNLFGSNLELYTRYGNVILQRNRDGCSVISFKGSKNTTCLASLLAQLLGFDLYELCLSQKIPNNVLCVDESADPSALFGVHMVVAKINMGKRVAVTPGCLLETRILEIFGPRGAVRATFRTDDELNSLKFHILDWTGVYVWIWTMYPFFVGRKFCADAIANNATTLSVTSRGSITICFSWPNCIEWTECAVEATLGHCRMAALLLGAFC